MNQSSLRVGAHISEHTNVGTTLRPGMQANQLRRYILDGSLFDRRTCFGSSLGVQETLLESCHCLGFRTYKLYWQWSQGIHSVLERDRESEAKTKGNEHRGTLKIFLLARSEPSRCVQWIHICKCSRGLLPVATEFHRAVGPSLI